MAELAAAGGSEVVEIRPSQRKLYKDPSIKGCVCRLLKETGEWMVLIEARRSSGDDLPRVDIRQDTFALTSLFTQTLETTIQPPLS